MQKKSKYNLAVVGVGAVGIEMLRVIAEHKFPVEQLCVFARTEREITVDGQCYQVHKINEHAFKDIDFALFAGTEGEKGAAVKYAQKAVDQGAIVIDNGADFRLKDDVPLVIPEVNPDALNSHRGIIANPNCSTIQMLAAIAPIYNCVGIKRIIVSTYQAVSGAGRGALGQLWQQTSEIMDKYTLSQVSSQPININASSVQNQIAFNTVPCIGSFGEFGYTTEEWKMVTETHKILSDQNIKISATCVRVPVFNCHSESVYFETVKQLEPEAVKEILSNAKGIIVVDSPMPKDCSGRDEVFVGRIRKDPFVLNGLWLWIVSDNLRKGAATNAVQIAECLIDNY